MPIVCCIAATVNETQAVLLGISGICAAGGFVALSWFAYVADRKPRTFSPQWIAATAKYRAAQNQDPISNQ